MFSLCVKIFKMSFFGVNSLIGNPFSSVIGQKIESATDKGEEDYALNIEICDLINESEDGPKDALKAIKKRLSQNAHKKPQMLMQTLTVLEMCVKNCGYRFHLLIAQKDFIQELVKLIMPKNEPSVEVQDRVLSLIQEWAETFRDEPNMGGVCEVFQDLVRSGIEFPPKNLDGKPPIFTPKVNKAALISRNKVQQKALDPEQRAKLLSELDMVQTNIEILNEMLNEANAEPQSAQDVPLMKELVKTSTEMQSRIMLLIEQLTNDEITVELLRINDELNNTFLRFSRWDKKRTNRAAVAAVSKSEETENLIDFATPCSSAKSGESDGSSKKDDFDQFVSQRNKKNPQSKEDENQSVVFNENDEKDFEEMAAWLQDNKISKP